MKLTDTQRKISYVILSVTWLAIAINYVAPFSVGWVQTALFWTGIGMGAAHLIEVGIFWKKLPPESNKAVGAVMLFLFGIVYASSLP
jgi:uncharacterized protein YhhL (DUF1145 family)